MIDQQEGSDCQETGKVATVADVAAGPTHGSSSSGPTAIRFNLQNKWKSACAPKYLFESRGKAALKAALRERNKLKLNKLPPNEPVPPTLYEQKAIRMAQQVRELKERKRSPKNNVIFTEPVVTQHYEYEPEHDKHIRGEGGHTLPMKEAEQEAIKSRSPRDSIAQVKFDVEAKHLKCSGGPSAALSSSDDDDDDDELYTLAPSDEFDLHAKKVLQSKSIKRSHESAKDLEDDRMSDSPVPGRCESVSGGLFSSPKVAKIAPYFDERPEERRVAGARAIMHDRYKLASCNQRPRTISYRNSNLAANAKLQLTKKKDPLNLTRPSLRATELLSYKKVSSPRVNDRVIPAQPIATTTEPADINDTYMDSQPNGYFSWLTSFLSHQMNKLIF